MDTKQVIAVMQAYVDGKEIQVRERFTHKREDAGWADMIPHIPRWDWNSCEYRVKPQVHEYWLNVYPKGVNKLFIVSAPTREDADKNSTTARIACIKISFTEGEGL